jgi:hypothetical protein
LDGSTGITVSIISALIASLSLLYTVWVDRFKYQGRPSIYIAKVADGIELTIVNNNSYPIQLQRVVSAPQWYRLKRSRSGEIAVHGRKPPLIMNPSERAIASISKKESEGLDRIALLIYSGQVTIRGKAKAHSVPVSIRVVAFSD